MSGEGRAICHDNPVSYLEYSNGENTKQNIYNKKNHKATTKQKQNKNPTSIYKLPPILKSPVWFCLRQIFLRVNVYTQTQLFLVHLLYVKSPSVISYKKAT